MILEFENSDGNRKTIGNPETVQEAFKIINAFLDEHSYRSYYKRINFYDDEWEIDCGSWNELFYLSDLPEDALDQLHSKEDNNE